MRFDLTRAVEILARTPSTLRALLRGLPEMWTRGDEGPETWSPFDVMGHLNHGERTDWIPRAKIILAEGQSRTFEPFDRYAQLGRDQERTLEDLLQEFEDLRSESLRALGEMNLSEQDLDRKGRHPEFGAVTLRQLLAAWVVHDLGHIAQIARAMAKQYREEAGPWRAYLPILGG
jgi:hypothetical protein